MIRPCGGDGCASDVILSVLFYCVVRLIQGEDRRIVLPMAYSNIGPDEARSVNLSIYGFPSNIFRQILLAPDVTSSSSVTAI